MAVQMLDLPGISASFFQLPEQNLYRDNHLEFLDTYFAGGGELAIVDGDPGAGKSTLLAQFAIRNSQNCFSLFIRGSSRTAYDPDFLRLIPVPASKMMIWPRARVRRTHDVLPPKSMNSRSGTGIEPLVP